MTITIKSPSEGQKPKPHTVTVRVPMPAIPYLRSEFVNRHAPWKLKILTAQAEIAAGDRTDYDTSEAFLASLRGRLT